MEVLILDRQLSAALIRERQRNRSDRYDEVWDGVYLMSPLANN